MNIDWEKVSKERAVRILQRAWITLQDKEYANMTKVEATLYNILSSFEKETSRPQTQGAKR